MRLSAYLSKSFRAERLQRRELLAFGLLCLAIRSFDYCVCGVRSSKFAIRYCRSVVVGGVTRFSAFRSLQLNKLYKFVLFIAEKKKK